MCNENCIDFLKKNLTQEHIAGKTVIEVGAQDINGSARQFIEALQPLKYIGVDIVKSPGVDIVCDATKLIDIFGKESCDVVIATEVIEHIKDWKLAIHNFKSILRPNGIVLITTRSKGYPYHGYPFDFWRFEGDDFRYCFSDFDINVIEKDISKPGVFIKAKKTNAFMENNLHDFALYSIIKKQSVPNVSTLDIILFKIRHTLVITFSAILPGFTKPFIKKYFYDPYK